MEKECEWCFLDRLARDPDPLDDAPRHVWLGDRRLAQHDVLRLLEDAARSDQVPTLTRAELRRRLDEGHVPGDVLEWLLADLGAE